MAAIDFPDNPTVDQEFTAVGRTWIWSGTVWESAPAPPPKSFEVSATAPPNPDSGDGWFDSTTGQFFVYYDDHWIEFGTNLNGEDGVAAAAAPLSYDSNTKTISINLSNYYTSSQTDSEITAAIAALVDSAPSSLDTLNELAAALSDDADFANTVVNQIGNLEDEVDTKASLTGSETLTNKTLTDAVLSGTTRVDQILESANLDNTAITGLVTYELLTNGSVTYYTTNSSSNFDFDFVGDSNTSLNSVMNIGESLTLAIATRHGATAYFLGTVTVDNSNPANTYWQNDTLPTEGTANGVDVYGFTIIKTANATFDVLASVSSFGVGV